MEKNDYQNNPLDWENDVREQDMLFHVGKPVFEQLERLWKDGDQVAIEDFLAHLTNKQQIALSHMVELNNSYMERFERLLSEGENADTANYIWNVPNVFKPNIKSVLRQYLAGKRANSTIPVSMPTDDLSGMETRLQETIKNQHKAHIKSIPLSEAFDKFIADNKTNWKGDDNAKAYRKDQFALFHELNGDIKTGDLEKFHVARYKEAVLKMPSNRNKMPKYRDLTIQHLMEMDIPEEDQFSTRNKQKYLQRLSGFLQWLQKEDYAIANIHEPLQKVVKTESVAHEEKARYGCADLGKLFNSKQYNQGLFELPFKFWIPLIGLFTGARENEIAQLHISDIHQHKETGFWVFNINQDDAKKTLKSIKRGDHARLVPIHKQLIKMGFLNFFESIKNRGEKRLFPECPYREKNKYGDKVQRWFNTSYTNKSNCNITTPKTSFHSLRHTLITHLSNKVGVPPHKISVMVGQKPDGGVTVTRYIKPIELEERDEFLQKVNFTDCIDFSKIRSWKHHIFAKK